MLLIASFASALALASCSFIPAAQAAPATKPSAFVVSGTNFCLDADVYTDNNYTLIKPCNANPTINDSQSWTIKNNVLHSNWNGRCLGGLAPPYIGDYSQIVDCSSAVPVSLGNNAEIQNPTLGCLLIQGRAHGKPNPYYWAVWAACSEPSTQWVARPFH
ncbi:hypothetical protein BDK51DRAFT_30394 [Blyttiomyces helicus]|uniref:Uncharacterized protein n=1 Tax=Blyttiomyces helicus TaxID=388810 RepID=A0A4V1ISI8_9FUNG|nr:hypothetical protein BDK51DRAFT_30394 [Blyttiomyces helicus]|eukprot:RKO93707.1 hypothetical protein BDK51DRAFT_30394 [Blyttiomyces helicus]